MTGIANTIECRLMCASSCAYSIDESGNYTAESPYTEAVGWLDTHPPVAIVGGVANINACLVGVNQDDGIIVAFRGTVLPIPVTRTSIMDWWQDIVDSEPRVEPNVPGKVHDGFANAVETLWAELLNQINILKAQFPTKPVYLTGHSKGGPMATIAAARMHFGPPGTVQPDTVYTFASPHPGNQEFVDNFPLLSIPVIRYENRLDIVPLVPPTQAAIDLAANVPGIGKLFKMADGWDYASLGECRYIKKNHDVIYNAPELTKNQFRKLFYTVVAGPCGLKKVAMAHMYTCGNGYMRGTCPSGVCP
jgi:hypothetical protein